MQQTVLIADILTAIGQAAVAFTPIFPAAALVPIGTSLVSGIINAVHMHNVSVVDESGNPVDLDVLMTTVQGHYDQAIALAQKGQQVADAEIKRVTGQP